jgi:ribosomal protein L21
MYAIIQDGGRQYKVESGLELDLDYREGAAAGDTITFDQVMAWCNDADVRIGTPTVAGASVTATVMSVTQGPQDDAPQERPSSVAHPRQDRPAGDQLELLRRDC